MRGTGFELSGLFHGTKGERAAQEAQARPAASPEWVRIPLTEADMIEYRYDAAEKPRHLFTINGERVRSVQAYIGIKSSVEPPEVYVLSPDIRYGLRLSDASMEELVKELKSRPGVGFTVCEAISGQKVTTIEIEETMK